MNAVKTWKVLIAVFAMSLWCGTAWAENNRPIAETDGDGSLDYEPAGAAGIPMLAVGDLVDFDVSLQMGADYLQGMQADITDDNAGNGMDGAGEDPDDPDDGGWDWRVISPPAPFFHTTAASSTNLYGVTGLGLYYAYLETADGGYFTALTDAANNMVADPYIDSGGDLVFLMLYSDLVADQAFADSAKTKYDARIFPYGSAQAFAQWIRDYRNGQGYGNGIIAWDIGVWARAAAMLDARYPGNFYDTDADDIAEVIWQDSFNDNPGYFDIVDDAGWDPTYTDLNFYWYTLGVTGLIDAFSASDTHTSEIPGLVALLLDSQFTGGAISYSYGANTGDEDWQSTGYAMMSLGNLDQATYQMQINWMGYWLGATQHASGGWVYASGRHYPEVGGECASGLYFTSNTLTEVLVDDDFTSQADVDAYNADNGTSYVWGYDAFASIQDGVDAVNGSTVNVEPGTYEKQVVINKSDLHVIGAGSGGNPATDTIIQSPTSLTYFFGTNYPIVGVHDATGVSIENLRVDGLGHGNSNYRFEGIAFWNAGGDVTGCVVTGVQDTPFSGAQHGVAIYSYNNTGGPYTVNVTDTVIDEFQKNAMALSGDGLTANVSGCTVTGKGATDVTAQNGIQIGFGAGGTVTDCSVSGIGYTGTGWGASGMLFYLGTTVDVSGTSSVSNSQSSIVYQGTNGSVNGVVVTSGDIDSAEGISVSDYGTAARGAPLLPVAASPFEEAFEGGRGDPTSVAVSNCVLTGVHHTETYGVAAWSIGDDVSVTVTDSKITDWTTGVVAYEEGSTVSVVAHYNTIANNDDLGFWTNSAGIQDAENNWWGDASGPEDLSGTYEVDVPDDCNTDPADDKNEDGLGDSVTDDVVDYCPWLGASPFCGDGTVDPGEECDDGNDSNEDDCLNTCVLNTCGDGFVDMQGPETEDCDGGDCCTDTCDFESSSTVCRGSAGVCDAEEFCTGSDADCPDDEVLPDTSVCRASQGECDPAEYCDGENVTCPGDVWIIACIDDDGCCPDGCNANNDNDCDSVCGNGIVEAGEDCDGEQFCIPPGEEDECTWSPDKPIPTVSVWGLVVLALLLLTVAKIYFGRRYATARNL